MRFKAAQPRDSHRENVPQLDESTFVSFKRNGVGFVVLQAERRYGFAAEGGQSLKN